MNLDIQLTISIKTMLFRKEVLKMPKATYGVSEARFFSEDGKILMGVTYRNRRTSELKGDTFPVKLLGESTNIEINDFLVDLIDRYENLGGD